MQTSLASGVVGDSSHFHMYFYGSHIHLIWTADRSSELRPVHVGDDPQDTAMQWKEELFY